MQPSSNAWEILSKYFLALCNLAGKMQINPIAHFFLFAFYFDINETYWQP